MQVGDSIQLRAYGGEVIERRVVRVEPASVVICKEEEFRAAAAEGREPVCVRFPLSTVVQGMPRSQRL